MYKTVSVIMPCYNDGAYIREAVESVRAQTYPAVELVIIDDGSDDLETLSILSQLKAEGNTVLLHTNHLRPAGARNAGITAATGYYILPLDADDRIESNYIELAVAEAESGDNVGIVYCYADLFGEKSGRWELPEYSFDAMLLDNIIFVTALFRKEDWETIGGFRTSMKYGMEDYDFWLSILELGRQIIQIPQVLFHYRIKPTSRTTEFMENPRIVQETYQSIYSQHPKLYRQYQDQYAIILRNALIDQIFLNRAYQRSIGVLEQLKKYPILKTIIKRVILK